MARFGTNARVDAIFLVGIASSSGALAIVAPVPVVVAAVVVALLLWRVGARTILAVGALFLVVAFLRGRATVQRHERAARAVAGDLENPWPARCQIAGTVVRSPALLGGGLRLELRDVDLRCRDGPASAASGVALHVPLDIAPPLTRGDAVVAIATLAPPYRFDNDGVGDPRPRLARRGVVLSGGAEDVVVVRAGTGFRAAIDRARAHVRSRILATFPAESAAMARALVLGEDDLPEDDQRAFRKSGLAHLLAVSGMHLILVVVGIVRGLRAVMARLPILARAVDVGRIASAVGLPVAWVYADFAGGSGSAIRAAWMCSITLLARALGRRSVPWRALGLSLLAMSVVDPLVTLDVSFALSALATMGLLAFARPIDDAFRRKAPRVPAFIRAPLATTLAATLACAPILATIAPELPIAGLVANVVAVPLGEALALPLCLVHALVHGWPAAERGCAITASGALFLVRLVARAFTWGALPVPAPTPAELAAIAVSAAAMAFGPSAPHNARRAHAWAWGVLSLVALAGLEAFARTRGAPHGVLRVTFLDVGQGDAALVDLPDGSAMLIDGGGLVGSPIDVGERVLLPVLAARRRAELDVVVLTHPHPDHYLGLATALARVRPRAFWDNFQGEAEGVAGPYGELMADLRRRGVPILRPRELCGARVVGGAWVDVLAPCPDAVPLRGANDNSFVIRIRYGERAILLAGDSELTEESELALHSPDRLRADVLKVGHHGSRTSSSPAFVAAVAPRVAVVSCGIRNRFGHPHPEPLATLARSGARVFRTDYDGAVTVTTDGHSLDVSTVRAERPP